MAILIYTLSLVTASAFNTSILTNTCDKYDDKVPIRHAPLNIIFQKNQMAASNRYPSIPQIRSDGDQLPDIVVCTRKNERLTIHTQWKCTSTQPFDRITVQWEGYHSQYDTDYFLRDSFSVQLHYRSKIHYRSNIHYRSRSHTTLEWCKYAFQTCIYLLFIVGIVIIMGPILDECGPLFGMLCGFGVLSALFSSTGDDDDDDWYSGDGYSSIR